MAAARPLGGQPDSYIRSFTTYFVGRADSQYETGICVVTVRPLGGQPDNCIEQLPSIKHKKRGSRKLLPLFALYVICARRGRCPHRPLTGPDVRLSGHNGDPYSKGAMRASPPTAVRYWNMIYFCRCRAGIHPRPAFFIFPPVPGLVLAEGHPGMRSVSAGGYSPWG